MFPARLVHVPSEHQQAGKCCLSQREPTRHLASARVLRAVARSSALVLPIPRTRLVRGLWPLR